MSTLGIFSLVSIFSITTQAQPKAQPTITVEKFQRQKEADFLKNNSSVANVHWKKGSKITLELKDGNKETYILNDPAQRKVFTDKYGAGPIAPPPPPVKK